METINIQDKEFEKGIEKLHNKIDSFNDADLKTVLNTLLIIVNSYYHYFNKINTSLQTNLTAFELMNKRVNDNTKGINETIEVINKISDTQQWTLDMLKSHGDMIDKIIDLIPKK